MAFDPLNPGTLGGTTEEILAYLALQLNGFGAMSLASGSVVAFNGSMPGRVLVSAHVSEAPYTTIGSFEASAYVGIDPNNAANIIIDDGKRSISVAWETGIDWTTSGVTAPTTRSGAIDTLVGSFFFDVIPGRAVGEYVHLSYTPEVSDPIWKRVKRCDGSIIQISAAPKLFAKIGTTYGGNGTTTFGLPSAKMKTLAGPGAVTEVASWNVGQTVGSLRTMLVEDNLPAHSHGVVCTNDLGDSADPRNSYPANTVGLDKEYRTTLGTQPGNMNAGMISQTGANTPFFNTQPTLIAEILIVYR